MTIALQAAVNRCCYSTPLHAALNLMLLIQVAININNIARYMTIDWLLPSDYHDVVAPSS